ncbi:MAG: tyrosine-protein phosphatase, partial [Alphaproteobacteria bacterium]|nr:tyrosine-protein phosphatase [Alphaproteobacteria bacterium]
LYTHLVSGEASPQDVADAMKTIYRSFVTEYSAAYRLLLERTAAGHLPLLFHCAAGKDRTGFAAALILRALLLE